jgi:DNA-binding FadR family transcriptional regulator
MTEADLTALLGPVRAGNAFEETVERLLTVIKLGVVAPGDRFPPERELAGQLGVSRLTLREAIKALQQAGFVESRRGRFGGTFVTYARPAPDPKEVRRIALEDSGRLTDALTFRLVVETGAAEVLAAQIRAGSAGDHVRAAGEHDRAIADRSRAGGDHGGSVADRSRAGGSPGEPGADRTPAGGDHGGAGVDRSRVGRDRGEPGNRGEPGDRDGSGDRGEPGNHGEPGDCGEPGDRDGSGDGDAASGDRSRDVLLARLADVNNATPGDYRRLDTLFHLCIAELTGSSLLAAACTDARMRLNDLLNAIPVLQHNIDHTAEQHTAIAEAILAGDAERARWAVAEHLDGTAALLRGFLATPTQSTPRVRPTSPTGPAPRVGPIRLARATRRGRTGLTGRG